MLNIVASLKNPEHNVEAILAFRKASAYLEITLNVTFIKMNNGDINENIGKNKANEYLKETEKAFTDNGVGSETNTLFKVNFIRLVSTST